MAASDAKLVERLPRDALIALLNDYFGHMCAALDAGGGDRHVLLARAAANVDRAGDLVVALVDAVVDRRLEPGSDPGDHHPATDEVKPLRLIHPDGHGLPPKELWATLPHRACLAHGVSYQRQPRLQRAHEGRRFASASPPAAQSLWQRDVNSVPR